MTTRNTEQTEVQEAGTQQGNLLPAESTKGETEQAKEKRQKAVRDAYAAAEKRLRANHLEEFNALHKEEAASRGYDWKPRPTQAEKDEAALKALLESNPELAAKVKAGEL